MAFLNRNNHDTFVSKLLAMIRGSKTDCILAVDLLTKAFDENKSVNFVVQQDDQRVARIQVLMRYAFNYCFAFGDVWMNTPKNACALILLPHKKKTNLQTIFWDIQLVISVIGWKNLKAVLSRESMIKKHHPSFPFAYLWFIGVEPAHQLSGNGSTFLKELLTQYHKASLPVYLETSMEKNVPWYQSLGFEVYQQLDVGYTLYLMRTRP